MVRILGRTERLTDLQKTQIIEAVQMARSMANNLWPHWESIYHQNGNRRQRKRRRKSAWLNSGPFRDWLGTGVLTNPQFERVNQRLGKIRRTLNEPDKIKAIYKPNGWCCIKSGQGAWNGGFKRRRIHICDHFFELGGTGRGRAIVHEMLHATGIGQWGHPGGNSSTAPNARQRAKDTPRKARRNAYNYQHLFSAFR